MAATESVRAAETFEEIYRIHASSVYRFCLSQLRDPSDAEDIAAEVFASGFQAYVRRPVEPDGVRAWLLRIAYNAIIDQVRRRQRWARIIPLIVVRDAATAPVSVEHEVVARDDLRLVLACLGRLKPRERTLVGLRVAANLPYAEVAAVVRMSEHAATVATRRALDRLRKLCTEADR